MGSLTLGDLLDEYTAAQRHSLALVDGLTAAEIAWRPHEQSSAIGWHLGHQAAVNHYMVRNLTAAEASFDVAFDRLFDSATPEPARGDLPTLDAIVGYRESIASSTQRVVRAVDAGEVGAPRQLARVAAGLLVAVINHEYQHAEWVAEVRATMRPGDPSSPASSRVERVDGYWMLVAD